MIELKGLNETDYFLPEDGIHAQADFLALLHDPAETYISAFGFTLQPMFDEIMAADAAGIKVHLLLDHSQSTGHAEAPKVKALALAMKNGDVTITTAGINSGKPSQIWHWKGLVVMHEPAVCWEGSVNFSLSGWDQGNSARIFQADEWAQVFIAQFEAHRLWARANEPQYQL